MKSIKYRRVNVCFKTFGKKENPAVVLLHGYLESMDTMEEMAQNFASGYFVITPDLPGHGLSGVYGEVHLMDDLAESLIRILDFEGINKIHLVGHSMGGYVTLAFRDLFPERLLSFILLHSHCFSDPEEKKQNREREIELLRNGKKELIISMNIPKLFADDNQKDFIPEIERTIKIAMRTPAEGMAAILRGMMERPDRSNLLEKGGIPSLLFAGMKDNHIPADVVKKIMSFARDMKCIELDYSGHMGFIEEKEKVYNTLKEFFSQL